MHSLNRFRTVQPGSVILGVVVLVGVLLLAYGYYQHRTLLILSGCIVIGAGVLSGILWIVNRERG